MIFVSESLDNIFKAKSEKEINKDLEKEFPLNNKNDSTKLLKAGILRDEIYMVKYALNNGADLFVRNNEYNFGNLWVAFNDYDDSKHNAEIIIIEMLKYLDDMLKNNDDFKLSIVKKCIYYGLLKVLKWVLKNYGKYLNPSDIISILHSPSSFKNNSKAHIIIDKWLDENYKEG